ncbi:class I SAM-dependent methyltransferase [Brevundimonas sp.]|uniref:class I SAM-dependent methyltransferase n=1 Tax=Brevundimonas sp. TaxID=1871086 RepID=UPI002D680B0B|nr:class I SAM-dependent methyltransferase [Brevundimonas sp.]HYC68222.1 class I SAM-dependent methyltransferase [Brevundimonas sp.]
MDAITSHHAGADAAGALMALLSHLEAAGYAFVMPTPGTHTRVRKRRPATPDNALRDIFGWSRPFSPELLDSALLDLVWLAGVVRRGPEGLTLTIRVSTVGARLFVHSAPTDDRDAVFLGPDSYRYVRFLRQQLTGTVGWGTALDIGTGAGVGAVALADINPAARVLGSDINDKALAFARINVAHAGAGVELAQCSGLPARPERFDVVAANPPYIAGEGDRVYRDGGDQLGAAVALEWVREGVRRLAPGGRFLLYTGSAIVRGRDGVREALARVAEERGLALFYEEIDPDVFGGTLGQNAYKDVERIAAVGAVLTAS